MFKTSQVMRDYNQGIPLLRYLVFGAEASSRAAAVYGPQSFLEEFKSRSGAVRYAALWANTGTAIRSAHILDTRRMVICFETVAFGEPYVSNK